MKALVVGDNIEAEVKHSPVKVRRTTITLPLALTQGFCYRVAAVASVECYPKLGVFGELSG